MVSSDFVHSYSRRDALADGFLVDVTDLARQAGFKVPVALTRAVWSQCVEWTEADNSRQAHQDETGRLWDVLSMCFLAARATASSGLRFALMSVPRDGSADAVSVELKALIHGGDDGEPVVTIMLPDED